jgi:hypothetical protein
MLHLLSKSVTKNYALDNLASYLLQPVADITSFYPKPKKLPYVYI